MTDKNEPAPPEDQQPIINIAGEKGGARAAPA